MTASRVAPVDPPGTLFKAPRTDRPRRQKAARGSRGRDPEHLEAIRQCPCLRCGHDPCGEAAHVRMGSLAGIARKPSDERAVPLCHGCHMDQHAIGEITFWALTGIAPLPLAAALWRMSPNAEAMRALCFVAIASAGPS
jgi:hypothetical protein